MDTREPDISLQTIEDCRRELIEFQLNCSRTKLDSIRNRIDKNNKQIDKGCKRPDYRPNMYEKYLEDWEFRKYESCGVFLQRVIDDRLRSNLQIVSVFMNELYDDELNLHRDRVQGIDATINLPDKAIREGSICPEGDFYGLRVFKNLSSPGVIIRALRKEKGQWKSAEAHKVAATGTFKNDFFLTCRVAGKKYDFKSKQFYGETQSVHRCSRDLVLDRLGNCKQFWVWCNQMIDPNNARDDPVKSREALNTALGPGWRVELNDKVVWLVIDSKSDIKTIDY